MSRLIISVIYHSQSGHTKQLAAFLAKQLETNYTTVHLLDAQAATNNFELLHTSHLIVFGCPTYFGNIPAAFKKFMEATGSFWYKQSWKDKLAAAFTLSSTTNGDKLNTLNSLFLFAAQHSMHWISLGVLPRYINDIQTDGQNRMGSYIGLMAQSENAMDKVLPLHPGDQLTAELFAARLLSVATQFNQINLQPKN
ncbi:MAG: flavodoxin family protein [Sediminibacterium sp.]